MTIHNQHYLDHTTGRHSAQALAQEGAVLTVQVYIAQALVEYLTNAGQPLPSPVQGAAIIDSGASRTCADASVLAQLGISPVGVVTSMTAAGQTQCHLYPASMHFPQLQASAEFSSVMGADLQGQKVMDQPVVALIGRDILSRGIFTYNGKGGFFTVVLE